MLHCIGIESTPRKDPSVQALPLQGNDAKLLKEDLDDLKTEIKEEMPEYPATLARYDDPDIDDSAEIWGF